MGRRDAWRPELLVGALVALLASGCGGRAVGLWGDGGPPGADQRDNEPVIVPDGGLDAWSDGWPSDQLLPPDVRPTPDTGKPKPPPRWVAIPAGTFVMGSPGGEPCRETGDAEETQHKVTLTRSFDIMTTEVTQAEFEQVMGYNPSKFASCGASCPVDFVTWYEATAFCDKLSKQAGITPCYGGKYPGPKIYDCPGYRLPTEAEWEYAYRAGTKSALYNGPIASCTSLDTNVAAIGWFDLNSKLRTHPVRSKKPNAWGVYDMAGNVWEWCNDRFSLDLGSAAVTNPWGGPSGTRRSLRGGSWFNFARVLRAAYRHEAGADKRVKTVGFRVVRSR